MMGLLASIGFVLILAGVTTLIIGSVRHFFPVVEQYFPESFKKPLSVSYAGYYVLVGLLLLLIQP